MKFPLLIRFQDILRHRVESINTAFRNSIAEFNYQGGYRGVFPIKVNQLREVVEEILKDPENLVLSGERRQVTVLFCDVRGFTPMSERLAPEEVVLLLNDFYTLMIETTFKYDGTLDKFLGDAVMAVFGAPMAHPDHSARAIRTALAMQEGITGLNERRVRDGKEAISVGIGVSAGEAVAGTVGTEDRMEYTVIGDSVNLAARLESNAKPGQILCQNVDEFGGTWLVVSPHGTPVH